MNSFGAPNKLRKRISDIYISSESKGEQGGNFSKQGQAFKKLEEKLKHEQWALILQFDSDLVIFMWLTIQSSLSDNHQPLQHSTSI